MSPTIPSHDTSAPDAALDLQQQEQAVGLVWGHLNARQYGAAHQLALGCLALWPGQPLLLLLAAYAGAELGQPLGAAVRRLLQLPAYAGLAPLLLRRGGALPC